MQRRHAGRLCADIARQAAAAAPSGWRAIEIRAALRPGGAEPAGRWTGSDFATDAMPFRPGRRMEAAFGRLAALIAEEGNGRPWLVALFRLDNRGGFLFEFEYEDPSRWRDRVPPAGLLPNPYRIADDAGCEVPRRARLRMFGAARVHFSYSADA
jgi:hypothetical protein